MGRYVRLDGDGHDEFIVGSGRGGNAFAVYGSDWKLKFVRRPYGAFGGGVNVAVGDVAGDGHPEIVVAPGAGGGPHVRAFTVTGAPVGGFFAYAPSFPGGVRVAGGDLSGDGTAEVVVAPASGGAPYVKVFRAGGQLVRGFHAFEAPFGGGAYVAVGKA